MVQDGMKNPACINSFAAVLAGGAGAVHLPAVLGIEDEIVSHLPVNILVSRVPIKPVGDGLEVDRHGFELGPAVLGDRPVGPAPVMQDEGEFAPLLFKD